MTRESERGAVLIQVAAALLGFTAVSAIAIDYGMILVSRSQIQASADAAALAGATALAFDDYDDRSPSGSAASTAKAVALANRVWDGAPAVDDADIAFPYCPDSNDAGPTATPIPACLQVDVFRNAEHGNALPSYVGRLLGASDSSVRARAVAEARDGNATDCLKPIAVPDRWIERAPATGPWLAASTFEKWNPANPNVRLSPNDFYTPPTWISAGSGLTLSADFGTQVTLTAGTTAIPVSPIAPWHYLAVNIPDSVFGNDVRQNVGGCAKSVVAVGDTLPLAAPGFATAAGLGFADLVGLDPAAYWDAAARRVAGSCAQGPSRCASMSPRIIALAVYDVNELADQSRFSPGATSVVVSNIVGLFIESVSGSSVTGRLVRHPGRIQPSASLLIDDATFLRASILVQ